MIHCSLFEMARLFALGCVIVVAAFPAPILGAEKATTAIHFNRDIRPILADNCFTCHGPDKGKRKAGLRLDKREDAISKLESGHTAIQPGKPEASRILEVLTTADEDDQMPPKKTGKKLTSEQVALLRDWIAQGAPWMEHWAYLVPEKPTLPPVQDGGWGRTEVDRFILARLEKEGLKPSKPADARTWLRRVTLDLTGLPPTVGELEAFLTDTTPAAREHAVDRLLSTQAYGERMAQHWLDLARYADSDGYHADTARSMWQYRDYVIRAFNTNTPFDQFTLEQLAGDQLPNPTLDQRIATAFNRNGMSSTEGGADPEEYMNKYVTDRVNTFGTVFLGSSIACTECHDHKYDPFTQREYYQIYDFFNRIPERGLDSDPAPPFIKVPTPENLTKLVEMTNAVDRLVAQRRTLQDQTSAELDQKQAIWENQWGAALRESWSSPKATGMTTGSETKLSALEDGSILASGSPASNETYSVTLESGSKNIRAIRLEALTHPSLPNQGLGRSTNGVFRLSEMEIEVSSLDAAREPAVSSSVQWNVWSALGPFTAANPKEALDKAFVDESNLQPDPKLSLEQGKVRWTEPTGWEHDAPQKLAGENQVTYFHRTLVSKQARAVNLAVGCDGGFKVWLNGKPVEKGKVFKGVAQDPSLVLVHLREGENRLLIKAHHGSGAYGFYFLPIDEPVANYTVTMAAAASDLFAKDSHASTAVDGKANTGWSLDAPLPQGRNSAEAIFIPEYPIAFSAGTTLRVKLRFQGEPKQQSLGRFKASVSESEDLASFTALPQDVQSGLFHPRAAREPQQVARLKEYYRDTFAPELKPVNQQLAASRKDLEEYHRRIPTLRIMEDMAEPRTTQIRVRGDYRHKGETVQAGVPHMLPPLTPTSSGGTNRLALAKWLTSPKHPLLSRVTVNRFWAMLFGTGLVKTGNEFGTQGEAPSHPELLDWLAIRFMENGWNVKNFLKELVLSSTYGQSSNPTPELLARDPANRLLARGPRQRLSAETIRDCALDYAALLDRKRAPGGPSVKPYQPAGLWEEKMFGGNKYEESSGADLYRRSLYTLWKRTVLNPTLMTFDAPDRAICTEQRSVTCTPLQAFVTLNEKGFVEAARVFAQRVMTQGGSEWEERLQFAYATMLSRPPNDREARVIRGVYDDVLASYQKDLKAAVDLLSTGEAPRPSDVNQLELVGWTAVANLMLNLDETVTKE